MRKASEKARVVGERLRTLRALQVPPRTLRDVAEELSRRGLDMNWQRYHSYERAFALAPRAVLEQIADWWKPQGGVDWFYSREDLAPYAQISQIKERTRTRVRETGVTMSSMMTTPSGAIGKDAGRNMHIFAKGMNDEEADVLAVEIGPQDVSNKPRLLPGDRVGIRRSANALPYTIVEVEDAEGELYLRSYEPSHSPGIFRALGSGPSFNHGEARIVAVVFERERDLGPGWQERETLWSGLPSYLPKS